MNHASLPLDLEEEKKRKKGEEKISKALAAAQAKLVKKTEVEVKRSDKLGDPMDREKSLAAHLDLVPHL